MRLATASIVVALSLVAASPGQAAVITLQALNAAQGGEFSNLGPTNQQAADDFVLAATTSLDSFSWFGRYFANIAVADPVDFTIRIFADAGGQPAAAALHTLGVSVNALPTGLDFGGVPWFSYSTPLAVVLTAGTYWISVLEDDAATPAVGNSQWMWGDSTIGLRATRNGDLDPWSAGLDLNHAFTLTGTHVPEPSTLALSALAMLGLLRYRRKLFLAVVAVMLAPLSAAAQGPFAQVPAEYRGEWVAASAACTAPVRVRVEATTITVINDTDKESLGGLEMAGPGFFPPDYMGIQAVAITEFSGDQPLSATFNHAEKKGVAIVEFAMAGPDRPGNAVLNKMNAHLRKLNLAKRFPLHQVPLKKCPAAR